MTTTRLNRRTLLGAALVVLSGVSHAQDSTRADWLRNPAMGNYKAYAEFKMAHYAEAREVWQTLAEVGNGDALFNLGILAEDGLGEPRDMAKAESLYTSAAQAGNFKAQYRLGMVYAAGTLLPRDVEKARVYLTLAAQGGDKDAIATLATLGQPDAGQTPYQRAEFMSATGEHTQAAALYRELAEGGDRRLPHEGVLGVPGEVGQPPAAEASLKLVVQVVGRVHHREEGGGELVLVQAALEVECPPRHQHAVAEAVAHAVEGGLRRPEFGLVLHQRIGSARHAVGQRDRDQWPAGDLLQAVHHAVQQVL